jgi:hypothetical protein
MFVGWFLQVILQIITQVSFIHWVRLLLLLFPAHFLISFGLNLRQPRLQDEKHTGDYSPEFYGTDAITDWCPR